MDSLGEARHQGTGALRELHAVVVRACAGAAAAGGPQGNSSGGASLVRGTRFLFRSHTCYNCSLIVYHSFTVTKAKRQQGCVGGKELKCKIRWGERKSSKMLALPGSCRMLRDASLPRSSWGRGHAGARSSDVAATGLGAGPSCWLWQAGLVGQCGSQKSSECPRPPAASGQPRADACRGEGGRFGARGGRSSAPTPLLSLFARLPKPQSPPLTASPAQPN